MKSALTIFSGLTLSTAAFAQEKPNVLFILLDDFGYHQTGCYGSTYYETPNIDRFAAQGMRFTQAYASAALSSPTRAALMSGMYPSRLKLTDWLNGNAEPETLTLSCPNWTKGLSEEQISLPQMMKENGYVTSLIGKWHVSKFLTGFDEVLRYDGPKDLCQGDDCHRVEEYTDAAIDFMTRKRDQPFFCFLSHNAIHTPESEESALVEKYRNKPGSVNNGQLNPVQGAMIERLDTETGRLLKAVSDLGLDENTIVIFFSDNGQYSPREKVGASPLRGSKVTLWEGGMREPLLVRWKNKIAAGSVSDAQVIGHDFLPTIAELCGISSPRMNNIDGVSFADNLLVDPDASTGREYLCWHYPHYHPEAQFIGAIRKGDWKLIENFNRSLYYEEGAFELYNLKSDPKEADNLFQLEPAKAIELYRDLQAWRTETEAQMPHCKKDIFGKAHFMLHQPNEPVKVNEFESQRGLASGLVFDGTGTYITLEQNNRLTYYAGNIPAGNYTFKAMCKNSLSADAHIQVSFSGVKYTLSVPAGSDWQEQSMQVTLSAGELSVIEIEGTKGTVLFDKWVLTNSGVTLIHDGKAEDTSNYFVQLAGFEADEAPKYTSLTGNANHQLQTPVIVTNPYADGINPTDKCLYIRSKQNVAANIPGWAANSIVITLKEEIEINEQNKFLHIMHWKERKLNSWLVYGSADGVTEVELGRGACPQAGTWFDIVVDVSSKLQRLKYIKLIADGNWTGSGESRYYPPTDFYYDEIILNNRFTPRTSVPVSVVSPQREPRNVSLFPNPASDELHVTGTKPFVRIVISDLNGIQVMSAVSAPVLALPVSVASLAKGSYIAMVVYEDGNQGSHLFIKN